MKKNKKKLIYDDGGIIPNVDSPEYQAYMSWLKNESLKNPITPLNPQDQGNYDRYLESIPQDESNIFNNYDPKRSIVSTSYKTPIEPIRPKLLDLSKLPTKQPTPIDTTPLGIEPKKNKDLSPYIMGGVDLLSLGIDRISQEKQAEQERQYRTQFFKPNTFNSSRGNNRNSQNLSVSDTGLTADGALVGNMNRIEDERGEQVILPDGTEIEELGKKHKNGGNQRLFPDNTKIYSDKGKMSDIVDYKLLSDVIGVNIKKNDTFAEGVRKINSKNKINLISKIIDSSKYDELSKNTSQLILEDKINKPKSILFDLQQIGNGDSNGERKMPDGGKIIPFNQQLMQHKQYTDTPANAPTHVEPTYEPRTFVKTGSQFIPGYEQYLDFRDIYKGATTGNLEQLNRGIIGSVAPFSGKALMNTMSYVTEKTVGKETADANEAKASGIMEMSQADRQKLYLKYGPGGYDKWKADGFPKLAKGGEVKMPDGGKVEPYNTSNYNEYVNRKQAYNDSLNLFTNQKNPEIYDYHVDGLYDSIGRVDYTQDYSKRNIKPIGFKVRNFDGGASYYSEYKKPVQEVVYNEPKNAVLKTPTIPKFVPDPKIVEKQKLIGVTPDGIWGPKSEQAWQEYNNTQTITPVTQNNTPPVAPTEKPKTQGYFKLNGREFPYSSEEELEQLKQSMSKYGKFANIGGQKNAYNFNGTGFKGWNDKGELIDKDGKVVFVPKQKFAMGGQVKYEVGQEYDLSKEEILELKRLGYKLK